MPMIFVGLSSLFQLTKLVNYSILIIDEVWPLNNEKPKPKGWFYRMNELFVPGRTELAGNHTDHQKGRILASAVDLGLYASFDANGVNL